MSSALADVCVGSVDVVNVRGDLCQVRQLAPQKLSVTGDTDRGLSWAWWEKMDTAVVELE